jgi:hypothetical protein
MTNYTDEQIVLDVLHERDRQDAKWGNPHDQPDGTGPRSAPLLKILGDGVTALDLANRAKTATDEAIAAGTVTLTDILLEEVFEALAEEAAAPLATELTQVAAVCVKWARIITERNTKEIR